MQKLTFIILLLGLLAGSILSTRSTESIPSPLPDTSIQRSSKLINEQAEEARNFCKNNDLDTSWCILIDMSIHSGKNRLFVYDLEKDSILHSALVSHGCGDSIWGADQTRNNPVFSNTPDSHLSSLGKYKVGKRGYSNWGIHINYKLHGLEATNSNAYRRYIVLHSWDMIPENECYPTGAPEGWGCPAVSNSFMCTLDKLLQYEENPILLWIYK